MEKRKKIFSWNKYLIQVSCCLNHEIPSSREIQEQNVPTQSIKTNKKLR